MDTLTSWIWVNGEFISGDEIELENKFPSPIRMIDGRETNWYRYLRYHVPPCNLTDVRSILTGNIPDDLDKDWLVSRRLVGMGGKDEQDS